MYDPFNRLLQYTDPLGLKTITTYTDVSPSYALTQDPKGIRTKSTFDAHQNLILKEKFHPDDRMLAREESTYDPFSRLFEHREKIYVEGVHQGTETFRYTYTPRGFVETLTLAADTDRAIKMGSPPAMITILYPTLL